METIRVGIVGLGFGTAVHLPAWRRCAGAEVAAVASTRRERAEAVAREAGVPFATDDYAALLERVDLVSIATPPAHHHALVLAAAAAGKHVLCEKPFAASLDEARAMVAAVEGAGVVHAIDHEFRYLPARAYLQQLIAEGYVGEPFLVRVTDLSDSVLRSRRGRWWWAQGEAGGILGAIGSHYLDACRTYAGEIGAVAATLDTMVLHHELPPGMLPEDVSADDTASLLVRFASGAHGSMHLSGVARAAQRRIEVYGRAGTLVVEDNTRILGAQADGALAPLPIPEALRLPRVEGHNLIAPFTVLAGRMLARIRGAPTGDFPTLHDALYVQAAMEAAYGAASSGRFEAVAAR